MVKVIALSFAVSISADFNSFRSSTFDIEFNSLVLIKLLHELVLLLNYVTSYLR